MWDTKWTKNVKSGTLIVSFFLFIPKTNNALVMDTQSKVSNLTKFRVSNKTEEIVNGWSNSATQKASHLNTICSITKTCYKVNSGTEFPNTIRVSAGKNGFVQTVIEAYNGHHNLFIRPDDIWIAILTQFSFYVNANSEEFRGKFVNFTEGKKELAVEINGVDTYKDAAYLVTSLIAAIHENIVDSEMRDWILPNFTTTKEDDIVTCGVILMSTLQKYFDYTGYILCGIPYITLDGTVEDWQKIKQRLNKLETYKLKKWVEILEPILDQFIQAKSGKPDRDFWQQICHHGSVGCGSSYTGGWITAFSVFKSDGNWQGHVWEGETWPKIETDDLTTGVVEVPVKIDDNGFIYMTKMFAGHLGSQVLADGYTLQPRSGWALVKESDNITITTVEVNDEMGNHISDIIHNHIGSDDAEPSHGTLIDPKKQGQYSTGSSVLRAIRIEILLSILMSTFVLN